MAEIKGLNHHTVAPFGWHTWEVTPTESTELTGTVDIALDTLPQGTVILDVRSQTLVGDVGATAAALDIEVGTTTVYDCGADSLGSAALFAAPTASNLSTANVALLSADQVVNCEITYSGTATTGPTFTVSILCGRVEY